MQLCVGSVRHVAREHVERLLRGRVVSDEDGAPEVGPSEPLLLLAREARVPRGLVLERDLLVLALQDLDRVRVRDARERRLGRNTEVRERVLPLSRSFSLALLGVLRLDL